MASAATILYSLLATAPLLVAAHDHASTPPGIIGFGIDLFQDACAQSCHDSLMNLWLNCTTFPDGFDPNADMMDGMEMDMDMSMMPETTDDCRASNDPWLQTMAYCIQQNCNAVGYPVDKQDVGFSTWALAGASQPTLQEKLPSTPPTGEVASDAQWLNETSLVNAETYYSTYGTYAEFARSEYIHTRYSLILYLTVIGFILIAGALAQARGLFDGFQKQLQSSSVWNKLQRLVFLPALGRSRRLEPLPANVGYVPGRALSIFLIIYVIMNIILSSVSFRSFQPNIYFLSKGFELCEYVGNRTGTLSFVNLSMAILFAGRNNLLIAITGWNQTTFLTLHRWTARMATLQAVVHSIVYTLAYWQPMYEGASAYAAKAAETFFFWGIIATIAMALILPFSFLAFRIRFYETFLFIHIVLAILALVGCWYHIIPHFGYTFGYQVWLYIAFAFWAFDRVARFARILIYNHPASSKAVIEPIPGTEIMHLTVYPQVGWGWGPGQHTFLSFPYLGKGKFWESHPFSVAGWRTGGPLEAPPASVEKDTGKTSDVDIVTAQTSSSISSRSRSRGRAIASLGPQYDNRTALHFFMRSHTGTTADIYHELFTSDLRPAEISVYNEGPYGGHRATNQPLFNADTVVCITGGIGITNALGFIQEYTSGRLQGGENPGQSHGIMKKATRFVLLWSAKEIGLVNFIRQRYMPRENEVDGIEYNFWCTDPSTSDSEGEYQKTGVEVVKNGRMNIRNELRSYVEKDRQTTVLICGPSQMADETTREVCSCIQDGYRVDVIEEAFAW